MKNKLILIFVLSLAVMFVLPVSAEEVRENPSFYSFSEIVQKLPKMWIANPIEVMEMMKSYPDFECWRSYDIIGCASVNNKHAAEIHVNYQFSSEDDYAEFTGCTFTMLINSSEDVQKVIESFWLPDMKAARIWGADYPDDQVTLYFSSGDTMMTYSIPWDNDGNIWMIMVDMGLIRG